MNRSEYMKAYREKNKEKIAAYTKAWEDINRISRRLTKKVADKKWRTKHHDAVLVNNRTPKRRFSTAKTDAKRRELSFELTFDFWWREVQKTCYYCRDILGKRSETTVGLDRLDNNKGYIEGNVVSCCAFCNLTKGDRLTSEETMVMINSLLNFRQKNT